jgi:hypothetical protein
MGVFVHVDVRHARIPVSVEACLLLFQLGFQLTRHISLFVPNLHVLILQVRVEAKKQSNQMAFCRYAIG